MSLEALRTALADRYVLDRELGAGGMATVYLAEDLKHHRKVAIKVLRPELAAVIGAERFLAEIRTTANLQHPHILALIDSGDTGGMLWYVMPYVEGESLRDRLMREKQLPISDAVRIATEVAAALHYAHRHGVIHRDITPENILLHDGSAMVADFGIALAASSGAGTRMTETGMSLGTPHYMSPEQAMGEREITARSDVYALGCITYEMLVGEPPFSGPTAQAIIARVMTEEPRPLTTQRKTVPPHVEAAVFTALEKLPADRFASTAAFAQAIEDSRFTSARSPAQTLTRSSAAMVPRRWLVGALAMSVLLMAGVLASWLRPAPHSPVSRQRVTLWHRSLGSMFAPGVSRVVTQAAIAPDGSSVVYCDPVSDSAPLMRKLRGEPDGRPLTGTEGGLSPFFSPDGRWVGFLTANGQIRKVPVEGGAPITLASDGNVIYPSAVWLDDGTVVYVGNGSTLRSVSEAGGPSRALGKGWAHSVDNSGLLSALPGHRAVLYVSCPGNCAVESSVYVYDLAADSGRALVPNAFGAWYSPTGHLLYTDRVGALFAAEFDLKRLLVTSSPVPVLEDVLPGSFAISSSGTILYAANAGTSASSELMWVSRTGKAESLDSGWRADFQYPALSPDGEALAVSVRDATTQLWIRRSDGTRQKLTDSGSVNWRPTWSPDGKSVVFLSNRLGATQGGYDVFEAPVDGSAVPTLLMDAKYGLWEAQLSPDGQWLAVRSDDGHMRARRLTGDTSLVPLVVDQYAASHLSISPDGHWLAYTSERTGRKQVYVTPFPLTGSTHLVSRDFGSEPRWRPDGRELFFKGATHLMAVPITPGSTFLAGTPVALFPLAGYREARNRQQYDVSPDGQHFIMIRELSSDVPASVIYAENWLGDLEARLKARR